jgi:hypothetical protein
MANVATKKVSQSYGEAKDAQKNVVFDLGAFVGDLTVEEDASGYDPSLCGFRNLR